MSRKILFSTTITINPPLDLGAYSTQMPYPAPAPFSGGKYYVSYSYIMAGYWKWYQQNSKGTLGDRFVFFNTNENLTNKMLYQGGDWQIDDPNYPSSDGKYVFPNGGYTFDYGIDQGYVARSEDNGTSYTSGPITEITKSVGDQITLTGEDWISLSNSHVNEGTIVIKDITESTTYVLNTDYAIQSGTETVPPKIKRIDGGSITDGQTVVAIYTYTYDGYNPTGITWIGGVSQEAWICSRAKYKISKTQGGSAIVRNWDFSFGSESTYAPIDIKYSCRSGSCDVDTRCFWITCSDGKIRYVCFRIAEVEAISSSITKTSTGRVYVVYTKDA